LVAFEEDEIIKLRDVMNEKQIWDLPIVDSSHKLIGLVHRHDVNQ
jgi:CBS domain-containing protein